MNQPIAYTLHLTELQAADLCYLLEHVVNIRSEEINDVSRDYTEDRHDEVRAYLQRELDVAKFVMECLPDPDANKTLVLAMETFYNLPTAMEQSETKTDDELAEDLRPVFIDGKIFGYTKGGEV